MKECLIVWKETRVIFSEKEERAWVAAFCHRVYCHLSTKMLSLSPSPQETVTYASPVRTL